MTIRYYVSHGEIVPEYTCQREGIEHARPICQRIVGGALDRAIGELLVETVSPLALEVALAVQDELEARAQEVDRTRRQQVERARYEADLAQRRYLRVDPDNRLVADSLEAEWNNKLRAVAAAQEEYERQLTGEDGALNANQRRQVMALATDFPRLWRDPATPQRERKRMVRLLLEDVTLLKADEVVAQIRFRGGATQTHSTPPATLSARVAKDPSNGGRRNRSPARPSHRCRDRRHPERPRPAARCGGPVQHHHHLPTAHEVPSRESIQPPASTGHAHARRDDHR